MEINEISEHKRILPYLLSRQILNQYKKAKTLLLNWELESVSFKKRQPYKSQKFYFRINKKYRAFCYFEKDELIVFEINDHQN